MTFRDDTPVCLGCDSGLALHGTRWSCDQCGSVLVEAGDVEQMMNELSPDDIRDLDQRLVAANDTPRTCPRCETVMGTWSLHGIIVDRCPAHGIWFDSKELMRALRANADAYNARNPRAARGAAFPLGIGVIVGALLSPWLDRRRLRKDIERTSPKK